MKTTNNATQTITTNQGNVIVSRYFDEDNRELTFTHMNHTRMVVSNEEAARLAEGHRAEGGLVA